MRNFANRLADTSTGGMTAIPRSQIVDGDDDDGARLVKKTRESRNLGSP